MNSKKIKISGGALDIKYRCAADVDYVEGSCYSVDQLKLLSNIVNKAIKKNILKGEPIKIINDKKYLLEQLKDRLKECKEDQTCWVNQKYVRVSNEIILEDVFRPNGTAGRIDWLSTENIDNVMEQYERKYEDYFFFGAIPIDFHEINYNNLGKIDYDDLMINGDKGKNEMMREFALKKFYWKYFEILQVYNKFRGKQNKYPFTDFHNEIVKTNDDQIKKNLDDFFNSKNYNDFIQDYIITENNGYFEMTKKDVINQINQSNQINENQDQKQTSKKSSFIPLAAATTAAIASATIVMANQEKNKGGSRKGGNNNRIKKVIFDQIISIKNKKYPITTIGIVPNLDEHWQGGSHWVAVYANLLNGTIYYFDSYGYRPEPKLRAIVKRIGEWKYKKDTGKQVDIDVEQWMTENNKNLNEIEKKYDIRYSTIRNQYKNSECGVYSMNFIIRLLNGSKFDNIVKEKLDDDVVNQCREIYFNNQKIISQNSKENFIIKNEKGGKIDITKKNYKCE